MGFEALVDTERAPKGGAAIFGDLVFSGLGDGPAARTALPAGTTRK